MMVWKNTFPPCFENGNELFTPLIIKINILTP